MRVFKIYVFILFIKSDWALYIIVVLVLRACRKQNSHLSRRGILLDCRLYFALHIPHYRPWPPLVLLSPRVKIRSEPLIGVVEPRFPLTVVRFRSRSSILSFGIRSLLLVL